VLFAIQLVNQESIINPYTVPPSPTPWQSVNRNSLLLWYWRSSI